MTKTRKISVSIFLLCVICIVTVMVIYTNNVGYTINNVLPLAGGGINALHLKTNTSDMIYYSYLDQNTGNYMITAYALSYRVWMNSVYISSIGQSDLHYAPSTSLLPNGSLIIFYGYLSTLTEVVSKNSVFSGNITKILLEWNIPSGIGNEVTSYPRPISYNDKTLVFVRIGASTAGDMAYYTYNETLDKWSLTVLTNTSSNLKNPYYSVWQDQDVLYVDYSLYEIVNGTYGRYNAYLIASLDEGKTWVDWRNNTLSIPFDVNGPLVCNAPDYTQAGRVWNKDGKTCIDVETAPSRFWQSPNYGFISQVIEANGTVPASNISWNTLTQIKNNNDSLVSINSGGKYFVGNNIWYTPILGYVTELSQVSDYQYTIINKFNVLEYGWGSFYPIDFDNSLVLGTYEKVIFGQTEQGKYQTSFVPESQGWGGAWFFRYVAPENTTITNICTLVNITTEYNGGNTHYYVAMYDDNGSLLGQALVGEPGIYGSNQYVPVYRYESASLNNMVNITAGNAYWLGTTGLTGGTMFVDNSSDKTQPYTAFYSNQQYVQPNLANYLNPIYYNYTATIFTTQKVMSIFGQ